MCNLLRLSDVWLRGMWPPNSARRSRRHRPHMGCEANRRLESKNTPAELAIQPRVDHWLCLDCARNKHSTEYGIADTGHCENCGREIRHWDFSQPMPSACCSDCRRMAANKRSRERRRVMHEPVTCEKCGEMFEPTRSDSRFCSSRCRQKAYRTRVREKPRSLLPCLGGRGRPGQMMCELQDDPAGPHFSLRTTHHTTERQCK
jgi:hypothetical protein